MMIDSAVTVSLNKTRGYGVFLSRPMILIASKQNLTQNSTDVLETHVHSQGLGTDV